jgi:hypothetical protein
MRRSLEEPNNLRAKPPRLTIGVVLSELNSLSERFGDSSKPARKRSAAPNYS